MITLDKYKCVISFNDGLILYKDKKFSDALKKFEDALSFDPADGPSKLYIERCSYFIDNPVPSDWDGVFEMKTK